MRVTFSSQTRNRVLSCDANICQLETSMFPVFRDSQAYRDTGRIGETFPPSWHFRSGLVTAAMVNDLARNNKRLLSVGAGDGYLERLLVKLGIKYQQMILADINMEKLPMRFERHRLDMYEQWPRFTQRFDYIIFPQSVLLLIDGNFLLDPYKTKLYKLLTEALENLNIGGQIRISCNCQPGRDDVEIAKKRLEQDGFQLETNYLKPKCDKADPCIVIRLISGPQ